MDAKHTHLHLNVQRTMPKSKVSADLRNAFSLGADTVAFCEMETVWHHTVFWNLCREFGYEGYLPSTTVGPSSALGVAVRKDYGKIVAEKSVFCVPGLRKVSPSRYFNRVQILRHADNSLVSVGEHQAYASGWTGLKTLDALRQARWYMGMKVIQVIERGATKYNEVVIGSGDLNRPPRTFDPKPVLGSLLDLTGMASTGYSHTDGTFGGLNFDYVWWLSKTRKVMALEVSTPSFNSDHDGVLITLGW